MFQRGICFLLALLALASSERHRGIMFTSAAGRNIRNLAFLTRRGGSSAQVSYPKEASSTVSSSDDAASGAAVSLPSNSSIYNAGEVVVGDPAENRGPLRVLFLSSDTGGGHRASAESLAKQFLIHFPGSNYDLLDVWSEDGIWPYKSLVKSYQHLSAHPRQWRFLYHLSNTRPWELAMDWHSTFACERSIRRRIASYNPDIVVSVHPAMNNAPHIAVQKISKASGKHIPFFTVVTDLGSGHCTWFQKNIDRIYVASERLYNLTKRRGRTPDGNIVMSGLPIRHDFAVQAEALGDRTSEQGKAYQRSIKEELGLDPDRPMILLMGGGEGVGSLLSITDELYTSLAKHGVDATVCVIAGRNGKLKETLENRDWDKVLAGEHKAHRHFRLFRLARRSKEIQESLDRSSAHQDEPHDRGNVKVVGLGFVTRMAEYMVAADVLVSKAGPGTIAEAAAVGLPVMLTSFLPGQEAGNVDFVLENGFGDYCDDPVTIAEELTCWLQDPKLLLTMIRCAQNVGHPHAAADIVLDIGSIGHTWMALNGPNAKDTSVLEL